VLFNYRLSPKSRSAKPLDYLRWNERSRLSHVLFLALFIPLVETVSQAQEINPRPTQPPPFPNIVPSPAPEPPLILPPTPTPAENPTITGSITVSHFTWEGNTIFSDRELENIAVPFLDTSIGNIRDISLSFTQLIDISSLVADYYARQGYRTSGAIVVIPEETRESGSGTVKIKIIEGRLAEIKVGVGEDLRSGKLNSYIASRLGVSKNKPLDVDRLLEALQLLQLDPLIKTISAQLSAGTELGESVLVISYTPAGSFSVPIRLDNSGLPSSGTFKRGGGIREGNLFGLGDTIELSYFNTDGSDQINFSYEVPFNASNGSIRFAYTYNTNQVIEPPFDDINLDGKSPDITSNYNAYDLTIQQPIIRSVENQSFRELSLGLTASWRNTQSFLFGKPFPLALSADILGNTRVFAIRLSQYFTQQNPREVIALNSQFSLGLNAFGSTVNESVPGGEIIPDSRFLAWRFQGQYVRLLAPDTLFLIRTNLQLSDRSLLPIEQFSTGGLGSVLGYRQDQLLTDNGVFLGTELRFPILRIADNPNRGQGILQIIPFINYGVGWNTETNSPSPNNLASVGLGLLWELGQFSARIDYGIPLISVSGQKNTWQENGIYFTIQYGSF
jgi:hemolysin activation/secretion protein